MTSRLRAECGAAIADRFTCVQAGAEYYRLSWRVAHAAYVAYVQAALAAPPPPVSVVGIDEIRRGRPVWARDPLTGRWVLATDRWLTGIVDAAGWSVPGFVDTGLGGDFLDAPVSHVTLVRR